MQLQHPATAEQIEAARKAEHTALLQRLSELEQRVAALEVK